MVKIGMPPVGMNLHSGKVKELSLMITDDLTQTLITNRELMELHKEELLEYKRSLQNRPDSSRRPSVSLERKAVRRPSKFNLPVLKLQPVTPLQNSYRGSGANAETNNEPKSIPPQWQSTRAKAGSQLFAAVPAAHPDKSAVSPQKVVVPPLDFSRLSGGPTIGVSPTEEPDDPVQKQKRKSFEVTFQRQTRLAAMLRKKK
ncbi:hypothetical protein P3T76_000216 [Phytophthora citrophthora]|uniref:Uncharacterized protein n=1 Tax=Phytophthora citrophthora TaxID=4793 RepID=A0AAD9H1L3_9STRA|nr:hypothetical protein P3T76_000216 [Phytophthora citrophthora]